MTNKRFGIRLSLVLLAIGVCFAWVASRVQDPEPAERGVAIPKQTASGDSGDNSGPESGKPGDPIRYTAAYSDPEKLVGQIVNPDGLGLPGIKVRLRTLRRSDRGFFVRNAQTNSNGIFVLEDLDPKGVYMLSTEARAGYPGYRLDGFTLESLANPFTINLSALSIVEIAGTVVDTEHAPVANFTLTIDSLDHNYPAQTITSDASGYFRLQGFPAGKLKIYTASSDYFRILGLQAKSDDYRNLSLVIDHGRYRLEGQILDPMGQPIEATRITLTSEISANDYISQAFRTRYTDAMGRFEFSELGGITQVLGVYATGYKPHIVNYTFQSFSDQLEIQLLN